MSSLFLFFDARVDPVGPLPWGALMLVLAVAFVLALGFVAGIVVLLIWHKRKKARAAAVSPASST